MTEIKPNAELAYRVLDHIDADPDSWNQRRWACGSAACFGGWAIQLGAGATIEYLHSAEVTSGPAEMIGMAAEEAANKVLGLDSGWVGDVDTSEWLYDPDHTREDLGRLVAEIFGPRPCANCPPGHDCERGDYATDLDLDDFPPNAGSAS